METNEQKLNFAEKLQALSPLEPPLSGSLLYSIRGQTHIIENLLQERDGVWFVRSLNDESNEWRALHHYEEWSIIWMKYSPIYEIAIELTPIVNLDEYADVTFWLPN